MHALRGPAAPLVGVVLALSLLATVPGLDRIAREGQLGPGFWPRLVLIGLALACGARTVVEWRRLRLGVAPVVGAGEGRTRLHAARFAMAAGLVVAYVVLIPLVGFALATAAFAAAFLRVAGARSPLGLGATAAGGTVLLLYVFIKVVYLPLPKGAGPFEAVTLALYRALGIF
jgi:putative tricarboxylic transport membrane protein